MSKLYELTGDYKKLQSLDQDDQAVLDTLEAIEGEITEKATNIGYVLKNADGDIAALDNEIKRLTERKRVLTNRQESLKEYLRGNMEAAGITKIECPLFSITLAQGRDVLSVDDEKLALKNADIVKEVVTHSLDKVEALRILKDGGELKGLSIKKSKSSIRIK